MCLIASLSACGAATTLRYGENPHQAAAYFARGEVRGAAWARSSWGAGSFRTTISWMPTAAWRAVEQL